MKRLIIIGLVALCIFLFVQRKGIFRGRAMVDSGVEEIEERAGIQLMRLDGIFEAKDYIEPDLPTIIEFYTEACVGCRTLHNHYKKFLKIRPDVAIRQIRLPNYWQPQRLWEDHKIKIYGTPHIIIYGPDGKLIAQDEGRGKEGFDFLYKWMNDELRKDWKKRQTG